MTYYFLINLEINLISIRKVTAEETTIMIPIISLIPDSCTLKLPSVNPINATVIVTGDKKSNVAQRNVMLDMDVRPSK